MDVEEDTISLEDDEEPFIYENFIDDEFNKIDKMVLDCYNAVLMNLGVEASIFRQVPSACVLTHTDTHPLHVHYTVMTVPNPHLGLVVTLILVQPLPSS